MHKPIIGKLAKGTLGAMSLVLILGLSPASGALAQSHEHGGGGRGGESHGGESHGGGFRGGGHENAGGGHAYGGHVGGYTGGHREGGAVRGYEGRGYEGRGVRGTSFHSSGRGYYRGYGGTRYLWGGLPFYLYDGYYYGDCGWLRERAEVSGSPYWWDRYRLCRDY